MNQTQLSNIGIWFCDVFEKEKNLSSKLRYINSKTHIHKEKNGIVVEVYEIIKPEIGRTK